MDVQISGSLFLDNLTYFRNSILHNNEKITEQHRTKENTKCLRTTRGKFPARFKATANETSQRNNHLRSGKNIVLTWNHHKTSKNKTKNKISDNKK